VYGFDVRLIDENTGEEITEPNKKGVIAVEGPLPPGCLQTIWGDDARFVKTYWSAIHGRQMYSTFDWGVKDADGCLYILGFPLTDPGARWRDPPRAGDQRRRRQWQLRYIRLSHGPLATDRQDPHGSLCRRGASHPSPASRCAHTLHRAALRQKRRPSSPLERRRSVWRRRRRQAGARTAVGAAVF
jgi:hypothetical protein